MTKLSEMEYRVLAALPSDKPLPVEELVQRVAEQYGVDVPNHTENVSRLTQLALMAGQHEAGYGDQAYVMAGLKILADKGLASICETPDEELRVVQDRAGSAFEFKLPERLALQKLKLAKAGDSVSLADVTRILGKDDVRAEVKWLTKKHWCRRDADKLVLTDAGEKAACGEELGEDEKLVSMLADGKPRLVSDIRAGRSDLDVTAAIELLRGRDDIVKRRRRNRRTVTLTARGKELKTAGIEPVKEVTQLTPELLKTGKWRDVAFKHYDVKVAVAPRYPGKPHPLQRVIQETRRAFFEMGFEEVDSPVVETAFWDFDALFQPQDHPAREMQDTFYTKMPSEGQLPDKALVERVARTHEDGGDTGSTGWRYHWDIEKAKRLVLRTHTTAATIRAVAANPNPPRKVFSIGKVFRRENVDATHLPEFVQIDGIIIDEQANLATLLGTLAEFYRKMGAKKVQFRPSFFPYTEPSAEVFAYVEGLGWVEMCGSGVFRLEVTRPLGCTTPVIAWGGGLERIAMLRFGLDDIRKLYWADIDWLREAKLCR